MAVVTEQLLDFSDPRDSQAQKILSAMMSGRKLTPIDALNDFGCFRLGGRIYDLKKQGYKIKDEWFQTPSGKRVKRYFM